MRIVSIFAAGAAAAGALTAASGASATELKAIYTGTVFNSYDYAGVFGPAGSTLNGDAFVATYTFNTAVGNRITVPGVSDHLDNVGPFGFPGGETATLTINGVTVNFAGNYSWSADALSGYRVNAVADLRTLTPLTDHLIYNFAYPPGAPPSLAPSPLTSVMGGGGHFGDQNAVTGAFLPDFAVGYFNEMTFQMTSVPEVPTWALMLVGFGGLGVALRSRRRTIKATL